MYELSQMALHRQFMYYTTCNSAPGAAIPESVSDVIHSHYYSMYTDFRNVGCLGQQCSFGTSIICCLLGGRTRRLTQAARHQDNAACGWRGIGASVMPPRSAAAASELVPLPSPKSRAASAILARLCSRRATARVLPQMMTAPARLHTSRRSLKIATPCRQ